MTIRAHYSHAGCCGTRRSEIVVCDTCFREESVIGSARWARYWNKASCDERHRCPECHEKFEAFASWQGCPAQVVIKKGWEGAGRIGYTLGPLGVMVQGQRWTPVLWNDEEDPDWHKMAGLEVVPVSAPIRPKRAKR